MKVQIHQAVAYQKYGDAIFSPGIMCRHQDNDKSNFSASNIILGTALDNHLDNPPQMLQGLKSRIQSEGRKRRKLSIQEADEIRFFAKSGKTYQALSNRFGVAKSTISSLVNYHTYKGV